jgi:hypothetical protein
VNITNGVDSGASMPPITVSADTVTATNVPLTSTLTSISPVVYCNPVGIEEESDLTTNNFIIYPNPASNDLHVHADNLPAAQIQVINALGKTLLIEQIHKGDNLINVSALKDGIYFMVITSGRQQVSSRKLIVQKR